MAAVKGLDILLKRGDGGNPTEVFTAVAGLRAKTLTFNKEQVDVTSADDTSRWRQLLFGAAVRSISASGSGVLKDTGNFADVAQDAFDDVPRNWQVIIPGIGTFEGPFQVNITIAGEHNAEGTYDISLESAGDLTFDPAP